VQDTVLYCQGPDCENNVAKYLIPPGSAEIPVSEVPIGAFVPKGFLAADNECTDCTLRGTKTQTAFWK
jgi:hypothetical protein